MCRSGKKQKISSHTAVLEEVQAGNLEKLILRDGYDFNFRDIEVKYKFQINIILCF